MKQKDNTVNFENQVFYIGIDVHKNSWSVTIRTNHMELKTYSMKPDPKELINYLNEIILEGHINLLMKPAFVDSGFISNLQKVELIILSSTLLMCQQHIKKR